MPTLTALLEKNKSWAERICSEDPVFFEKLSSQQDPDHLWIGCADSRVPASEIVDVLPGEIFVHRNVGNVVGHTDLNCLAVLQYAVEQLQVKNVIVCGHYGCGGVKAALEDARLGLIDNWTRQIRAVRDQHEELLSGLSEEERLARLCELNVLEQVTNICQTTVVEEAWERGQELDVHGLIYGLEDGLLKELGVRVSGKAELERVIKQALERYAA